MSEKIFRICAGVLIALIGCAIYLIIANNPNTAYEFSLEKTYTTLETNQIEQIKVIAKTGGKQYKLSYKSHNPNIAIADYQGNVRAINEGNAIIEITNNLNDQVLTFSVIVIKKEVLVTEIKLSSQKVSIGEDETIKLTATIIPNNATNKELVWTSSNKNIATVENGIIRGIAKGTTIITAKTSDEKIVTTCSVNVLRRVTGIALDEQNILMYVGDEKTIKTTIIPSDASNKSVVWSSSNESVVSVKSGKIKALKEGTATIKAITVDGDFEAKALITVKNSIKIHFIKQVQDSADAILLESNGHYAMIDTGLTNTADMNRVKNYLESLNVNTLDFILITHNHADHIGGGATIIKSGINVKKVYIKTYLCKDAGCSDAQRNRYNWFITAATDRKIPITYIETLSEGYTFNLDAMKITLYNTVQRMNQSDYEGGNENVNSVVQYIQIGNIKTFLGADSYTSAILTPIIKVIGQVDVVKIPHHAYSSCGVTDASAKILSAKQLIITNSVSRLGGSYVNCITHFSKSIPRYFANDMNKSVIVDYSSGTAVVVKN